MKSLSINGEVLRIENNKYYVLADGPYDVLVETTRKNFIKEMNKYADVCMNSWDKELRKQYLELVKYCEELEAQEELEESIKKGAK